MGLNDRTFKAFYDQIQELYDEAKRQGVMDPVVVLRRANNLVPSKSTGFQIANISRPDAVRILWNGFPEAAARVASPVASRPMTVIIHDKVLTVFECIPSARYVSPDHESILRRSLESSEMEWLRAKDRGMVDPVIEILDKPLTETAESHSEDPILIDIELRVHERGALVGLLKPISSTVAAALAITPPTDTPMTIVIGTMDGVSIVNRPAS